MLYQHFIVKRAGDLTSCDVIYVPSSYLEWHVVCVCVCVCVWGGGGIWMDGGRGEGGIEVHLKFQKALLLGVTVV